MYTIICVLLHIILLTNTTTQIIPRFKIIIRQQQKKERNSGSFLNSIKLIIRALAILR